MLSDLFKAHLIRHLGMGPAFKDTHRALKHLGNFESIQALEQSEGTPRTLREHWEGTWALGGHLGTRSLRQLGTRTLKAIKYLDTYST